MPEYRGYFFSVPQAIVRITKTHLYNFDPIKPHVYIVKLGFNGVYIIFLILLIVGTRLNHLLTSTYNLCFEQEYEKNQIFLSETFPLLVVKFSLYLNRRVFVMGVFGNKVDPYIVSSGSMLFCIQS